MFIKIFYRVPVPVSINWTVSMCLHFLDFSNPTLGYVSCPHWQPAMFYDNKHYFLQVLIMKREDKLNLCKQKCCRHGQPCRMCSRTTSGPRGMNFFTLNVGIHVYRNLLRLYCLPKSLIFFSGTCRLWLINPTGVWELNGGLNWSLFWIVLYAVNFVLSCVF